MIIIIIIIAFKGAIRDFLQSREPIESKQQNKYNRRRTSDLSNFKYLFLRARTLPSQSLMQQKTKEKNPFISELTGLCTLTGVLFTEISRLTLDPKTIKSNRILRGLCVQTVLKAQILLQNRESKQV